MKEDEAKLKGFDPICPPVSILSTISKASV